MEPALFPNGFPEHSRKARKKPLKINGQTSRQGDGDTHGRVRKIKDLGGSSVKRAARIAL
jgi:hypothetical protein